MVGRYRRPGLASLASFLVVEKEKRSKERKKKRTSSCSGTVAPRLPRSLLHLFSSANGAIHFCGTETETAGLTRSAASLIFFFQRFVRFHFSGWVFFSASVRTGGGRACVRQRAELRLPGRPLLSRFFLGGKKKYIFETTGILQCLVRPFPLPLFGSSAPPFPTLLPTLLPT